VHRSRGFPSQGAIRTWPVRQTATSKNRRRVEFLSGKQGLVLGVSAAHPYPIALSADPTLDCYVSFGKHADRAGSWLWTPLYDVDDIGPSGSDTVGEQCIGRGRVQFLNQIVMIVFVNAAREYRP
jgi:hypothetical protein